MDVDANRDEERVTALVDAGDVAVVATATEDAHQVEVLDALAQLTSELEIGLTVLSSSATDQQREEPDHATDHDVKASVQALTDGGQGELDRAGVVRVLRDVHDDYLAASSYVASGRDEDALEAIEEVREALDTAEDAIEGGF